jgi:hypothetical protein
MSALAAGSERLFRLIQRPPIITSVSASGNILTIRSYVTGLETPMVAWNGENIHFFIVASVALVLAVPLRSRMSRVMLAALAVVVGWAVALVVCAVQLDLLAEVYARQSLGITLHTAREKVFLESLNQALVMIGMLLVPSFLFLLAYLALRLEPRVPVRAGTKSGVPPAGRSGLIQKAAVLCGLAIALSILAWALLAASRPAPDPRAYLAGWAKLAELNPDFAPAHVNVGVRLEEAGRVDEAIAAYRRALRADPGRTAAHYNLGNALIKKGLYAEAVRSYEQVLSREPGNGAAHKNLAIALLYLGRPCEALAHLERSAELDARTFADERVAAQIDDLRRRCGR